MSSSGIDVARERLASLTLLLIEAHARQRPLTQEEIVALLEVDSANSSRKVRAYEGSDVAVRQKFERDKAQIRENGLRIITTVDADQQHRYSIDPDDTYAPALDFTDDERQVVAVALRYCGFGRDGALAMFAPGRPTSGGLEYSSYLTPIVRAINLRSRVSFDYITRTKRRRRDVEPLHLRVINGVTYLVAREHDDAGWLVKGYRFSRIHSMPAVSDERSNASDEEIELARHWSPSFHKGEKTIDVLVATSPTIAALIQRDYPRAHVVVKKRATEVGVVFDDRYEALRFVLAAGERVRLLAPDDLVKEAKEWLRRVNKMPAPDLSEIHFAPAAKRNVLGQTLAMLSAIHNASDGLRISELASRFEMSDGQVRDLMGRLATLEVRDGPGGFTYPARIIKECDDWDHEDTEDALYRVTFEPGDHEPTTLTWAHLFELNVALREAATVFDDPAIFSAIAKLENLAGGFVDVAATAASQIVSDVVGAIDGAEAMKISYLSGTALEPTERIIEPRALQYVNGHAMVRAYCQLRSDWRTFRVDRITAVVAKSPALEDRGEDPDPDWLTRFADDGDEVVVVADELRRYLFEALPGSQSVGASEGLLAVKFRVADPHFLDHLMVMAGPGARVVSDAHHDAGLALARRMREAL